jgi:predicted nucleic acid-binding Zn ribbon protein
MKRILDVFQKVQERFPALKQRTEEAHALSRWEKAVGPQIAKHSKALRVKDQVLWIYVDHPIWKAELHSRKRQILEILNGQKKMAEEKPLHDLFFTDRMPVYDETRV